MTITLTAELDRFVHDEVAAGRYASISEAICDALDRLRREREAEELRKQIDAGLASLDRGAGTEIRTPDEMDRFFGAIKERGRRRLDAEGSGE